ncbi:YjiH family protein [Lutibacter sp. B2]|nr:YjiH family protein [Lutibacter sp. B2]
MSTHSQEKIKDIRSSKNISKFIIFSVIGIFMFFVPIAFNGKTTIPLDHIVSGIRKASPGFSAFYTLIIIILGGIYPFYKKTWNKDRVTMIFSLFKFVGIFIGFLAFFEYGPTWLFTADMLPFIFSKIIVPIGLIIPIGAVFLTFIIGYGLLEFIGVLMKPVMRPIWKTPGRSAIDAVGSFVGSYSIGLLITNKVFKEGKYTIKEASIIATGFSTVSATFMIIVAKTLGLMEMWNTYFWVTLVVTFIVTAITVRIRPLKTKEDRYITEIGIPEPEIEGNIFTCAIDEGLKASFESRPLTKNIIDNIKDGFLMAMGVLPTVISIGLMGALLAKYTPLFDVCGYIFYPFTLLLQIPEPMLTAKASAINIADMSLPLLLVAQAPLVTRFVIGVVCISTVLFFSASIPCILSTDIPITISEIVIIAIERTIITLILIAPIAMLIL